MERNVPMSMTAGIFAWQILMMSLLFSLSKLVRMYMYRNAMKVSLLIAYWTDMMIAARVGNNCVSTV